MSDQNKKPPHPVRNRLAQRAFRERKAAYVKELEEKLRKVDSDNLQLQVINQKLLNENENLRRTLQGLSNQNETFKRENEYLHSLDRKRCNITTLSLETSPFPSKPIPRSETVFKFPNKLPHARLLLPSPPAVLSASSTPEEDCCFGLVDCDHDDNNAEKACTAPNI